MLHNIKNGSRIKIKFFFSKKDAKIPTIEKKYKDPIIFGIGYLLLVIGCIIVISSSYSATKAYKFGAMHFATKHFFFAFIALVLMNVIGKQNKYLKKIGLITWLTSVAMLVGVLIFGHAAKGAQRWISLLGFNLQPSEFVKIGVILQSAKYLKNNLYMFGITYTIPVCLILFQPDLGTSILLLCLACGQLLTKNENLNFKFIALGLIGISLLVMVSYYTLPHVQTRINIFLNPNKDLFGVGYQKHKAFLTIISGGWFGKGFGKGEIKDSLPDAHTDYVFAVIAEEFGVLGSIIVILLFLLLGLRCLRLTSKNEYSEIIQYSTIILILGQAWLNIASTLAIIPSKGITMPLVSYGGSGIITQGILFGLLLAVSEKKSKIEELKKTE